MNEHLFLLINAAPGLNGIPLLLSLFLARYAGYLVPLLMAVIWMREGAEGRRDLLQMLYAMAISMLIAHLVRLSFPHPRPFVLHLGQQYLAHGPSSSLPSSHTTFVWSIAVAAFFTRRLAVFGFPLLTLGLLVGWSRVYLGVHFPFDIAAALPVSIAGAFLAWKCRAWSDQRISSRVLRIYDSAVRV